MESYDKAVDRDGEGIEQCDDNDYVGPFDTLEELQAWLGADDEKNEHNERADIWCYQSVYTEKTDSSGEVYRTYTVCEIFYDEEDRLIAWTEDSSIAPLADSLEGLTGDLKLMLHDITHWKPVAFGDLRVGMTFERIDQGVQKDENQKTD